MSFLSKLMNGIGGEPKDDDDDSVSADGFSGIGLRGREVVRSNR